MDLKVTTYSTSAAALRALSVLRPNMTFTFDETFYFRKYFKIMFAVFKQQKILQKRKNSFLQYHCAPFVYGLWKYKTCRVQGEANLAGPRFFFLSCLGLFTVVWFVNRPIKYLALIKRYDWAVFTFWGEMMLWAARIQICFYFSLSRPFEAVINANSQAYQVCLSEKMEEHGV